MSIPVDYFKVSIVVVVVIIWLAQVRCSLTWSILINICNHLGAGGWLDHWVINLRPVGYR